jgi:hypothetical protein
MINFASFGDLANSFSFIISRERIIIFDILIFIELNNKKELICQIY